MYNIIFYNLKVKTVDGNDIKYRIPSKLVFDTAVSTDELLQGLDLIPQDPDEAFKIDMPCVSSAIGMFEDCELEKLAGVNDEVANFQSLTSADRMFKNTRLTSCKLNCSSLKFAEEMFSGVPLTEFEGDLKHLINGNSMFAFEDYTGPILKSFNVRGLVNLESADKMMGPVQFETWTYNMPSLKSAVDMFSSHEDIDGNITYPALTTFKSDLSSLQDGTGMFKDCTKLQHFDAPLSSLENGEDMFTNCVLNAESLLRIVETLPYSDTYMKTITIGVDCWEANIDKFIASTNVYDNLEDLISCMQDKGWIVEIKYNPVIVIPDNLQQVEYIHSNDIDTNPGGTSSNDRYKTSRHYIDTGIIMDDTMGIKLSAQEFAISLDGSKGVGGCYFSDTNCVAPTYAGNYQGLIISWNERLSLVYTSVGGQGGFDPHPTLGTTYYNTKKLTTWTNWMNDRHIAYAFSKDQPKKYYVGYTESGSNKLIIPYKDQDPVKLPTLNDFSGNSIYLFASNKQNTPIGYWLGRIYEFEVTKNNMIIHKFIPVITDENQYCMYDVITGIIHRNVGESDFVGPAPTTYSLRRPEAVTPEWAIITTTGIRKLYCLPDSYNGTLEDYVRINGFKKLIESECPNEEGKDYYIKWRETDTEIISEWIEYDPNSIEEIDEPEEPTEVTDLEESLEPSKL